MSVQNGFLLATPMTMSSQTPLSMQSLAPAPHQPVVGNSHAASSSSQSMTTLVSPLTSRNHLQISSSVPVTSSQAVPPTQNGNGAGETTPVTPVKRGPGRPKGSKNTHKPPVIGPDGNPIPKRPVGRPRKEVDPNAPVKPKNPVGRPRKHPIPSISNPTVVVRPAESSSQHSTSATASSTTPTVNRASVSAPNDSSVVHVRPQQNGNTTGGLLPQYNQQIQPTTSASRLAPSPTIAPSTPIRGRQWSSVDPHSLYRNSSNGHTQIPHPSQSAPPHLTSATSTSSGSQFQFPVFDASADGRPPSVTQSPVVEQHQLAASRRPSSPLVTSTLLQGPSNHRPLPAPHPVPPQPPVTLVNAAARNQASPSPLRQSTSRLVSPQWEQIEASIWKEIQKLDFINPRIKITSARARAAEYNALKRSVPPSVLSGYSDHLKELRRETPASCPDTYTILNSFWLPGVSPYFQLTTSRQAYSSTLSNHRFFYWDPMYLLVGGIPCPTCSSRLSRDGFHGPCPVLSVGDPFYLIGQVYKCTTCLRRNDGTTGLYLSWDEGIITSLPDNLAKEFPASIKPWGAVSNSLQELVRASAKAGMEPKQVCEIIRSVCRYDTMPQVDPSAMQELPPSPITAPSSPELPERQRIYYRAWHRNGRLPDSLAPSGGSPDNRLRDVDGLDEDMLGLDDSNLDPLLRGPSTYGTSSQTGKTNDTQTMSSGTNKSPRSSSAGTSGKTPTDKTATKPTGIVPPPVIPGGIPPVYFMPPGFFPPPASGRGMPVFYPPSTAPSPDNLRRPNPYSEGEGGLPNKKRRVRHCAKCGSQTCKGRGGGSNCPNPCRDCGKAECKGRSSTKPGRPCDNSGQQQTLE